MIVMVKEVVYFQLLETSCSLWRPQKVLQEMQLVISMLMSMVVSTPSTGSRTFFHFQTILNKLFISVTSVSVVFSSADPLCSEVRRVPGHAGEKQPDLQSLQEGDGQCRGFNILNSHLIFFTIFKNAVQQFCFSWQMSENMKKMEKETNLWKSRFENCNKALTNMMEEVCSSLTSLIKFVRVST